MLSEMESRRSLRLAWAAVLAFGAWTVAGLVFALPGVVAGGAAGRTLLGPLAQWWAWGLVAPVIAWADGRLGLHGRAVGKRLMAHVPLSLVATAVYLYVQAGMRAAMGIGPWSALWGAQLLESALRGMFLWSWLVYWLILGAWLARQYHRRYLESELRMERLERLSSEARMHALRLQLDPHFLFNALNTISSQVESDPKLARRMIEHLGDLLRLTLETKERQRIPLAEELAFLDHYLAIQRIRFGDRLRFECSLEEEVRHALVPSMTIQPLVENAVRHGISKRASGGRVRVTARRLAGRLQIVVEDDGVGLPAEWSPKQAGGLGLSVTRQRIAGLYPDGGSRFEVRRREGGGVAVEMELPLEFDGPGVGGAGHG